jgi:hypothetical protein
MMGFDCVIVVVVVVIIVCILEIERACIKYFQHIIIHAEEETNNKT